MVLRATTKAAKRLKTKLEKHDIEIPILEEWYIHQFIAERMPFLLLTNAATLYSCLFPAKGITNLKSLADLSKPWLATALESDGFEDSFINHILKSFDTIKVYATNNRGVLGSMNDMIANSKYFIAVQGLPLPMIASRLNDIPYGYMKYGFPVKELKKIIQNVYFL